MTSPSPQSSPMPPPQAPSPMGPPTQSPGPPSSPHSPYQSSSMGAGHLNAPSHTMLHQPHLPPSGQGGHGPPPHMQPYPGISGPPQQHPSQQQSHTGGPPSHSGPPQSHLPTHGIHSQAHLGHPPPSHHQGHSGGPQQGHHMAGLGSPPPTHPMHSPPSMSQGHNLPSHTQSQGHHPQMSHHMGPPQSHAGMPPVSSSGPHSQYPPPMSHVQHREVGAVQVLGTFCASLIIEKVGRKVLLLISLSSVSINTVLLAIYFSVKTRGHPDAEVLKDISFIPVVALCLFVISFSLGMGPIPWMITSEILPTEIRSQVSASAGTINWLLAGIITKGYLSFSDEVGEDISFYLFTVFSVIGTIFILIFVPETKGKTVSEIQEILAQ